jgi:hypothetical protein
MEALLPLQHTLINGGSKTYGVARYIPVAAGNEEKASHLPYTDAN